MAEEKWGKWTWLYIFSEVSGSWNGKPVSLVSYEHVDQQEFFPISKPIGQILHIEQNLVNINSIWSKIW